MLKALVRARPYERAQKNRGRYLSVETTRGAHAMTALSPFDDLAVDAPPTEGVKYAGSKRKLLPYILDLAQRTGARDILDGFSGSTRVAQAFAKSGYRVISNDIAVWSQIFGTCYLLNDKPREHYSKLIRCLNEVPPRDGWFTEHYGGEPNGGVAVQCDGLKKPWQVHNTRKLDGVREEIDNLSLSPTEKPVALTSLVLALDRVDSTLGHHASYLRNWSYRSFKELRLELPLLLISNTNHEVMRKDVFDIADLNVDLAYFDPPYGSNNEKMPPSRVRYASYYHLWTTICLNDSPELFGKAMRRRDTSDTESASVFEEFRKSPRSGRFLDPVHVGSMADSLLRFRWPGHRRRDERHSFHEWRCRRGDEGRPQAQCHGGHEMDRGMAAGRGLFQPGVPVPGR